MRRNSKASEQLEGKSPFKTSETSSGVLTYTPRQSWFGLPIQRTLQLTLITPGSEHLYEFPLDPDGLTA